MAAVNGSGASVELSLFSHDLHQLCLAPTHFVSKHESWEFVDHQNNDECQENLHQGFVLEYSFADDVDFRRLGKSYYQKGFRQKSDQEFLHE